MLEQYAKPPGDEPLFEVELRPSEESVHKGKAEQWPLTALLGRRNRILIGVPQTTDVLASWPKKESLADEIASLQDRWDFYNVRLACSFLPDRGCRFVWACMGAELSAHYVVAKPAPEVIAFDLFPREVGETRRFRRSFKITPALKFAFAEVSVALGGEGEVLQYEPQMAAAGLLTSAPTWTFTSSSRHGLVGSRELFVLVKKPKGATIGARFVIGAEVKTRFGLMPLKRSGDDRLVDESYPLVP